MSYLKMALRALESATERGDPEAQTASISSHVSDHTPIETSQATKSQEKAA